MNVSVSMVQFYITEHRKYFEMHFLLQSWFLCTKRGMIEARNLEWTELIFYLLYTLPASNFLYSFQLDG